MTQKYARPIAGILSALVLSSCRTIPPAGGPQALPAAPQPHPRLYLNDTGLPGLRLAVDGSHAHIWTIIKRWTDAQLANPAPTLLEGDFRRIGEMIPYAALCHRITGEQRYLDLAVRYMTGISRQAHWADDADIEAAHLLYALAVGYDWLHGELQPDDSELVRDKLITQATRMRPRCGRRHPPLNNHRIVNLCALGIAAIALQGETPGADEWRAHVEKTLRETLDRYGSDGYSCEGLSYWSYTTEYLLKYLMALPGVRSPLLNHEWIRNAALSPLYHALPRDMWSDNNMFLNIGDSPRFCWYGPHYQLFCLASLYGEPGAQWMADQIVRADLTREHSDWLSLLWYDPSISCEPPADVPLSHYYRDWDLAVMRSGTTNGTVCSFKCGPAGSGHSHPDANSFTIFSAGSWLAADAGASLVKRTSHHNTILVNGVGQAGEGDRWLQLRKRRKQDEPSIIAAGKGTASDYFVGDASDIYRSKAGLTRFRRHFLYQRPDRITVVDELAARRESEFEWLLHTPGEINITAPNQVVITNGSASLKMVILQPDLPLLRTETIDIETEYPNHDWTRLNRLIVSPACRTRETTFSVIMQIEAGSSR